MTHNELIGKMDTIESAEGGPVAAARKLGVCYATWWKWRKDGVVTTLAENAIENLYRLTARVPREGSTPVSSSQQWEGGFDNIKECGELRKDDFESPPPT